MTNATTTRSIERRPGPCPTSCRRPSYAASWLAHAGTYRSHQPIGLILPSTTWQAPAPIIPIMEPPMHPIPGAPAARRDVELAHVAHPHPTGIINIIRSRSAPIIRSSQPSPASMPRFYNFGESSRIRFSKGQAANVGECPSSCTPP